MASAFDAALKSLAMVSRPSVFAFSAKARYLLLAVVSPMIPALRFSMVFTGLGLLQLVKTINAIMVRANRFLFIFFGFKWLVIKASCNYRRGFLQRIRWH